MQILSVRKGFASDHSSTSYEFLAVDKPLEAAEKAKVSRLSSRVSPTARRASFVYNSEFSDIPNGWEPLVEQYYDLMYSESYGTWTLAFGFPAAPGQLDELQKYAFDNGDEQIIEVQSSGNRAIVVVYCHLEPFESLFKRAKQDDISCTGLFALMIRVRKQLMSGDYRALYALWEKYGNEDELDDEDDFDDDDDFDEDDDFEDEDSGEDDDFEDEDSSEDDDFEEGKPPKPKELPTGLDVVMAFKHILADSDY
jgi:hypothetical protein